MRKPNVYDCSIIELLHIKYRAGNITPITNNVEIPFAVKRVFYIYDIPGGGDRGAHAHKECHQFLVAVSGSFEIELNDGNIKRTIVLNRPYFGLHVLPGVWAAEKSFSSGAVCLVLTSHEYDENDYIKKYKDFLIYRRQSELTI
jgi:hypothetical protein